MLNSPAVIFLCTYWWLGLKRRVWPHMATRPVCFCRATTFSPSASTSHSGISTCTCLPASRQAMVWLACICVGVHKMTASTSLMARLSARSVVTCLMPYLSATSWVLARSRLMRETTSTPSMFLMPSRCLMPKAPAPASATLMVMVCVLLRVLENQVAHGVVDELVEEGVVKLFVDEAGARALQLVAHATRAPDVHVQVFVIALHGLADGLAQVVAAAAPGHPVLHHVDGELGHRAGPGALHRVLFAKHQRQGHGQAVVHGHLVEIGR